MPTFCIAMLGDRGETIAWHDGSRSRFSTDPTHRMCFERKSEADLAAAALRQACSNARDEIVVATEPDCERCRRALGLLAELVKTWDHSFPPSARFSANFETMLLIVDVAALVRRVREELEIVR